MVEFHCIIIITVGPAASGGSASIISLYDIITKEAGMGI
jgi:hypothetical protein